MDAGGFMTCQYHRTRGILHNGHALAFHYASFGFFLFKLKTTWLGSTKQLFTQTAAMLDPFLVCSLFIADIIQTREKRNILNPFKRVPESRNEEG